MGQIERAIELYALYGTPSSVWRKLKEEFGESAFTYDKTRKLRESETSAILKKRRGFSESNLRILDPAERWSYLQQIIDDSLGEDATAKDRSVALQTLKMADDMSQVRGAVKADEIDQDSLVRDIVYDTFEKMKALPEYKGKSITDVVEDMRNSELSEQVTPYLEEILNNYKK